LETLAPRQYVAPSALALVYAALGDKERTLAMLEKGVAVRDDGVLHARNSPYCAFLRDDPRFKKFLQELKPLE
jgi:hypothetical protein